MFIDENTFVYWIFKTYESYTDTTNNTTNYHNYEIKCKTEEEINEIRNFFRNRGVPASRFKVKKMTIKFNSLECSGVPANKEEI